MASPTQVSENPPMARAEGQGRFPSAMPMHPDLAATPDQCPARVLHGMDAQANHGDKGVGIKNYRRRGPGSVGKILDTMFGATACTCRVSTAPTPSGSRLSRRKQAQGHGYTAAHFLTAEEVHRGRE